MDPSIWFWMWVVLAVALAVGEIFTAGFFLLPFAIGATAAAVIEFFWTGSAAWQWGAFIGISILMFVVLRRFADSVTHDAPVRVAGDRLIGRRGTVVEAIEPHDGLGRVRVDREEWRADTDGPGTIAVGTRVEVLNVVGTHLMVKPIETETTTD